MQTDRIALIFLNWRTPHLTVAAVRSAQQTAPAAAKIRIILVDNASGDDSLAVFARELPDADVVAMPENAGFARAMNAALARVTEPVAFLLNSDITFMPEAIRLLVEALEGDSDGALACPRLLRTDGSEQAAVVPEPRLWWELTNRSLPRHLLQVPQNRVSAVPSVVGPCMALHMERCRKTGFLDERFFFFFEETDFCRRLNQAGFHVLYVPQARVVHLQGESANRRPVRARIQFYESRMRYFRKHGGAPAALLLAAGMVLRLTADLLLVGLAVLLTLGLRRRLRDKWVTQASLWSWHLLGCPRGWGFEPASRH